MGIKNIQYQATRPTSVTILLFAFQAFKALFPDKVGPDGEELIYNGITILGATGLIEKVWNNRKEIKDWIKRVFTNK